MAGVFIRDNLPGLDLDGVSNRPCNHPCGCVPKASQERTTTQAQASNENLIREISDQIGLVSDNAGTEPRYLGPSSGLFFTRFVLAGVGRKAQIEKASFPESSDDLIVPAELLDTRPRELPSDLKHAQWLTQTYFQNIHLQFPFLHEPTHMQHLQEAYDGVELAPAHMFQIFMVLAIGATVRSRRAKVLLSAEGYCASAMIHLGSIFQGASLGGVQSILLLQMYTINNPSSGLSLWTAHYNCLAYITELGLQRNVPDTMYSSFEQEMRTRAFWCAYTLDRTLSTLLGRPIGMMDEQCDLRLPRDIDDKDLTPDQHTTVQTENTPTTMSSAIHLFKLARLNSETKCILYCVDRQYPPYTQPATTDIEQWQKDMLHRLKQWKSGIPQHHQSNRWSYLNTLSEIKYHELVMLIVRPSPLLRHPPNTLIRMCFSSALQCSRLYHRLYVTNRLRYGWFSIQSLFLCVITMFYCVWAPEGVGNEVKIESIMQTLKSTSDILSAAG